MKAKRDAGAGETPGFSTGATWIGFALLAAAAGLALLLGNAADEVALSEYVIFLVLALVGVASLVLASFCGARPGWWTSDAEQATGSGADVLIGFSVLVAGLYGLWASPYLEEGLADGSISMPALAVGAVCVAAAFRAAAPGLAAALGLIGGALLWVTSGDAAFILGHGALTVALGCLVLAAVRTGTTWIRAVCSVGIVGGLLLWLYYGFVVLLFYGCGSTHGCLS